MDKCSDSRKAALLQIREANRVLLKAIHNDPKNNRVPVLKRPSKKNREEDDSSDSSQSSIIFKGHRSEVNSLPRSLADTSGQEHNLVGVSSADMANTWSPFGVSKTKSYKPVSFRVTDDQYTNMHTSSSARLPPKTLPKKSPHFVAPPPPSSNDRPLFDSPPSTYSASSPSHSTASSSFASPQKPVSPVQRSSVFDTPVSPDRVDHSPRHANNYNSAQAARHSVTSSANQPAARYRPITSDDLNSLRKTPPSPKITRPSYMPLASVTPPPSHTSNTTPPRMKPMPTNTSSPGLGQSSPPSNSMPPLVNSSNGPLMRNSPTNQQHRSSANNPRRQTVILNTAPKHDHAANLTPTQRQATSANCALPSSSNKTSTMNSPQRQLSSPYYSDTPCLQRQNSNPSSQRSPANQTLISLNNTQSLPRPNSAMARSRNIPSPSNNSATSPGASSESKGLSMFYKQRTKLNAQDVDSIGGESPKPIIKQNSLDRVDRPANSLDRVDRLANSMNRIVSAASASPRSRQSPGVEQARNLVSTSSSANINNNINNNNNNNNGNRATSRQYSSTQVSTNAVNDKPGLQGMSSPPIRIKVNERTTSPTDQSQSTGHVTSGQSDASIDETFGPIFGGIGPTDPSTGVPTVLRSQIDKGKQKDWYKQMYASIHKGDKPDGSTMSLGRNGRVPSMPKYRNNVYKCQPKNILDYTPGDNEPSAVPSYNVPRDYCESDSERGSINYNTKSRNNFNTSNGYYSDADEVYLSKKFTKPTSSSSSVSARVSGRNTGRVDTGYCTDSGSDYRQTFGAQPCVVFDGSSTLDRRSRNQQQQSRLRKLYEEQRIKKFRDEIQSSENRRLGDIYHTQQKIPSDRFDYENQQYNNCKLPGTSDLDRPEKNRPTKIRGKARALYSFRAQHRRELTFRRGETIYLLRSIDKNWYEGEHNGRVGLLPVRYVEVIKSIEEASLAASLREGRAIAKYNFKPESADELSLRKGDEITLIRRLDDNWLEGKTSGVQGIFPISYVDIINAPQTPLMTPMTTPLGSYACTPDNGSPGQMSPVSTMSNGPAPTIPSAPMSPRRLSIDFNSDCGGGGGFDFNEFLNRQKQSVAPSRYLNNSTRERTMNNQSRNIFEKPTPASHLPIMQIARDGSSRRYKETNYPPYRVVYDYSPRSDDELRLRIGDLVYVVEKCDDGWYVGTSNSSKEFGTFPGNYVKPV